MGAVANGSCQDALVLSPRGDSKAISICEVLALAGSLRGSQTASEEGNANPARGATQSCRNPVRRPCGNGGGSGTSGCGTRKSSRRRGRWREAMSDGEDLPCQDVAGR